MLPQTKEAIDNLVQAGLKHTHFRVRTPWNRYKECYEDTMIILRCTLEETSKAIPQLRQHFKVVVIYLDGLPRHISLECSAHPGLYRYEQGRETPVGNY